MQVTKVHLSDRATARSRQIVQATFATIAEVSYLRASFVEVAMRAALSSTRLISCHFDDLDEPMAQVANDIVSELGSAVEYAVRAAGSPARAVRSYVEANVAYMDAHRPQMAALLFAGVLKVSPGHGTAGVDALTAIIAEGRQLGQFSDVDPAIAATIMERDVEGVPLHLRAHLGADLRSHAEELVRIFDAALLRRTIDGVSW